MQPSDTDVFQRHRVLYLTTVGRKSGQPREIEIWFVTYQGRFYLLAEHGHNAQWVRNIQANPEVSIRIKQRQFPARGRILDAEHDRQEWDAVAHLARGKYGWGEGLPVAIEVHGADLAASKLGS
jgi:deazaflavin-dependent oxidoreductase (nitroreductase family)